MSSDVPSLGAVILDDVVRFIRRFVVLSAAQADALALWDAHTHAIEAVETTPYLAITSPEKRSGKTRLLEVLELLVHDALPTANTSDAALFRSVSKDTPPPTLLLDEVDAIFKGREREDPRGLLNAGFRRGAVVRRMGGKTMTELQTFPVFCAKAFAGIGNCLPDTILDRSITIALQRKTRDETVDRFRRRDVVPEGDELRDRLADWLVPQVDELHRARPHLPEELDDRAQDMWEPLLVIADLAGGDWPERARRAARELSTGEAREDDSLTACLLRDVYQVFETVGVDRFKTSDLIDELVKVEESPWGDWYGKTLTPQALSTLLRKHRIKTMTIRGGRRVSAHSDGKPVRGYRREQFADAFARVLGVTSVTGVTSESSSQKDVTECNAVTPSDEEPSGDLGVTALQSVTSNPALEAGCNAVTPCNAGDAREGGEEHDPLPGDDGFLDFVAAVHRAGHVTTAEPGGVLSEPLPDLLPPRIPRAEAVGPKAIAARMYDIGQEVERVDADLEANQREYDELSERRHFLASEYGRLRRKLVALAGEEP